MNAGMSKRWERNAYLYLGWFVIAFCLLLFDISTASDLQLSTEDCRYCHGTNVAPRHHLLINIKSLICFDCHQLAWDSQRYTFVFVGTHECNTCHVTSVADKHHVAGQHAQQDCLYCHDVLWDATNQTYYVTFNFLSGRQQVSHYYNHTLTSRNDCTSCHLDNNSDEHESRCNDCHQSTDPYVQLAVSVGYRDCTACHGGPNLSSHLTKCTICHNTVVKQKSYLMHFQHASTATCGICHNIPDQYPLETTGQHCGMCHGVNRPYTMVDIPSLHKLHVKRTKFAPYSCVICHGRTVTQTQPTQCNICHDDGRLFDSTQLETVHRTHANRFDCTNCHSDVMQLTNYSSTDSCLRCHEARIETNMYLLHGRSHFDKPCWSCHTVDMLFSKRINAPDGCIACHPSQPTYPNAETVHIKHSTYPCWACHTAVYPIMPTMRQPINFSSGSMAGVITNAVGTSIQSVRVLTEDGHYLTLSREGGAYALRNLTPGTYMIRVEKAGYETVVRRVKIPNAQTLTQDFTLIPLPAGAGAVMGKVLDGNLLPVAGAMITSKAATSDITAVTAPGDITAVTGPDGRYSMTSMDEGSYVVLATKVGYYSARKVIALGTGQLAPMDLTLTPIPIDVQCAACHENRNNLVNCDNKKWKKHRRDGYVDLNTFNQVEITLLSRTCATGGPTEEPRDPVLDATTAGDLSIVCNSCHSSKLISRVQCDNTNWIMHRRQNRVNFATYELAEFTNLGKTCH